ncbi:MAG: MaoC family dehydratase N-terminal domain-containing protein [Desulfomonile tiedjei]|nr:MaoC family dehydratase N-terminal domain-containing protein [Desulfomonile tiedjei]
MTESLLESLDWKKYIGQETGTHTGEPVLARDIRRYALAIDDLNPIYFDEDAAKKGKYGGLAAPLNYISWAVGVPGSEKAAKELGEDGLATFVGVPEIPNAWALGWVRGGEEIEFLKPVYANDQVTVKGKIVDMSEKEGKSGRLIFVTSEFVYTNQKAEVLAKHRVTMIATPRKESENE